MKRFLSSIYIFRYMVILFILFCSFAYLNAQDNPIHHETEINDCDVIKYNGQYYITGNWLGGDMYSSRNLVDWGNRTHIFSWNNTWHTTDRSNPDMDIHGTHIRYHNGVFHLYAHLVGWFSSGEVFDGITHATSTNIWGPYTEPVDSQFAVRIDADTFLDEDGSLYFYCTKFSGGNGNYLRTMSYPSTFSSTYQTQIYTWTGSGDWENGTHINEGPKVFRYRDRYFMLYNAYPTSDPDYSIGCVEASSPTTFFNSGKYSAPILTRTTPPGSDEIAYIGQPWMVEGLNGFERWIGYFGQTASEGRTQRIDRMHFFEKTLFIDGPTNRYTTGYHPSPAEPQLRSIFTLPTGTMPTEDYTVLWGSSNWSIFQNQALQNAQDSFTFNTINRDPATHYLIEANVKFFTTLDSEDKAGLLAYYLDDNNWLIVGLDRYNDSWYYHMKYNGSDTVVGVPYSGSMDYNVYHKIRVEKNGNSFKIRIDDKLPPSCPAVVSSLFSSPGIPGLYADHAAALFDGVIYTVGFDEFDSYTTGWSDNINGFPQEGNWTYGTNGITQTLETGFNYTFKGDLMEQYEFATQVIKAGSANGTMGIFPVAIDANNYVGAEIDLALNELLFYGAKNGIAITPPANVALSPATSYNIRAVKLPDRIIIFVDGQEKVTINESFGPSQVGLVNQNMSARYNGILLYETEPKDTRCWLTKDIGAVGFAGDADIVEDTFYINSSGSDIWHTNDEFRFTHRLWSGNGHLVARIDSIDPTDYWAKAGIMFRQDNTDNSPMAMYCYTPGGGNLQLIWRNGPGYGTGINNLPSQTLPVWLKLSRAGSQFNAYYSYDGTNWTYQASCSPPLTSDARLGLCVTAHNNTRITGAVFDNVSSPHTSSPVSAPWTSTDIGENGLSGNADFQDDTFIIESSGAQINSLEDGFHYVYKPFTGESRITARIVDFDADDTDAFTGIMIRDSNADNTNHHTLGVDKNGNLQLRLRQSPATGTGIYTVPGSPFTLPLWVRLERSTFLACEFEMFYSTDGTNWTQITPSPSGWKLNCMNYNAIAGLAVTSANTEKTAGAVFDNVSQYECTILHEDGDINNDCLVNYNDLELMADQWLTAGASPSADIYTDTDNTVNFMDFVKMAAKWLDCGWLPDDICPSN